MADSLCWLHTSGGGERLRDLQTELERGWLDERLVRLLLEGVSGVRARCSWEESDEAKDESREVAADVAVGGGGGSSVRRALLELFCIKFGVVVSQSRSKRSSAGLPWNIGSQCSFKAEVMVAGDVARSPSGVVTSRPQYFELPLVLGELVW